MTDKAILAYFKSPEEADEVMSKLKEMRVTDVRTDGFSRYPGESVEGPVNPLTGNITSLAGLSADATVTSHTERILIAADPSLSGLSDGGQGGPTGRNVLLTAIVSEAQFKKASQLIEEGGGMI